MTESMYSRLLHGLFNITTKWPVCFIKGIKFLVLMFSFVDQTMITKDMLSQMDRLARYCVQE